jgi:polysaccharide biosynthesis protein PslG
VSARILLALLLGLFIGPSAGAFEFGVCTHLALKRGNAEQVLSLMSAGGFNSFRDDAFWGAIESEPGTHRFPEKYGELRKAMAGAAARGQKPMVVLAYGNRHYDAGGLVVSRSATDAYAKYAGFVARELKGQVRQFEIWNEWNSGFGSKPKVNRGDAQAYVRMLEPAAAAIHRANPDAEVIGGVTAGVDLKWFRAFIAAGGLAHIDAVSVHSYTLFRREINPEGAIVSLDKLHALLEEAEPRRVIPVYVTEIGWPTNKGKHGVEEREAAMYLARFTLLARTRPWIAGVWWYDLIDDGDSDTKSEQRFGLVRRSLAPKPALHAAKSVAPLLKSSEPHRAYRFPAGGYLVTGADAAGRWAVGWKMSERFLAWEDGSTREAAVPGELSALGARLPADGYPLLFRRVNGVWQRDAQWADDSKPRPSAPVVRVSRAGAA